MLGSRENRQPPLRSSLSTRQNKRINSKRIDNNYQFHFKKNILKKYLKELYNSDVSEYTDIKITDEIFDEAYLVISTIDSISSLPEKINNFVDDVFDDMFPFAGNYTTASYDLMKTDVKDAGDHYELEMEMPGVEKENIKAELKDGYLTLAAAKGLDKDEKDKEGNYIRRERYAGTLSRSFYVGDAVSEEDIHAKYEDGILKLSVPKKAPKAVEEKDGYIAIEG